MTAITAASRSATSRPASKSGTKVRRRKPARRVAWLPLLGLVVLLTLWLGAVRIMKVPAYILPAPEAVVSALWSGIATSPTSPLGYYLPLWSTLKNAALGLSIGCCLGLLLGSLMAEFRAIEKMVMPYAFALQSLPKVAIAPLIVIWFGFGDGSKIAISALLAFFPMLVNTLAGLNAAGQIERDLMHSYAAGYWQTLLLLRLPNALPFVFNALKINSTLSLIGAIVAEFFGTPIVGMGFRISTEVGRMNIDMVWATIAVAALAGSMFYGAVALIERGLTFWHPSYRH